MKETCVGKLNIFQTLKYNRLTPIYKNICMVLVVMNAFNIRVFLSNIRKQVNSIE